MAQPSRNNQASGEMAQVSMSDQGQPGKIPGEVLCCASLSEVKISEDEGLRPMKRCKASNARAPSPSVDLSPDIMCPPMVLASAKHHMSLHHMTYPETSTSPLGMEATKRADG